jgi:hypothetical protein
MEITTGWSTFKITEISPIVGFGRRRLNVYRLVVKNLNDVPNPITQYTPSWQIYIIREADVDNRYSMRSLSDGSVITLDISQLKDIDTVLSAVSYLINR